MMNSNDNSKATPDEQVDLLLQQLMHLKQYEKPEVARMTRNKQNITRLVREENSKKRKSIGDLLEMNIPWFFAEPRYGIAVLFVAFAGLQFLGSNAKISRNQTGIYTSTGPIAALDQGASYATNSISYPRMPDNLRLFASPAGGDGSVKPAGFKVRR
jgi:hypothetical protein